MAYITNGQKQYDALNERYGCKEKNIKKFFHSAHKLEEDGRSIGLRICNEAGFDGERHQKMFEKRFNKFLENNFEDLQKAKSEFILNWDPRGYCIKIEAYDIPKTDIYMDWGRSGILIPTDIEINGIVHRDSEKICNDRFVW